MRHLFRPARAATLVAAAALTLGVTAAAAQAAPGPTYTKSHTPGHSAPATTANVKPDGAYTNCPDGDWCLFTGTDGSGQRLAMSGSDAQLGATFSKSDLSFANRTNGLVRLYFFPSGGGAWACVDSTKYRDVFQSLVDEFNNGSGDEGFNSPIQEAIQSVNVASGGCSNPLPWG